MPTYASKGDVVTEALREMIAHGELAPGTMLRQRQLAQHFQVSPTPVREALRRLESEGLVQVPGGPRFRRSRITYSVEGPHHIELIQQLDDTAWRAVKDGPLIHHLGFSVTDLTAESERLVKLGFSREAWHEAEDGALVRYAYHHNPHGGIFIELVEQSQRTMVARWLETGRPPS